MTDVLAAWNVTPENNAKSQGTKSVEQRVCGGPHTCCSGQKQPLLPLVGEQKKHKLHVQVWPQNSLAHSTRDA
jgi:hypothetical protein